MLSVLEVAFFGGLVLGKFVSEVREGFGWEVVHFCVYILAPAERLPLLLPLLCAQHIWLG